MLESIHYNKNRNPKTSVDGLKITTRVFSFWTWVAAPPCLHDLTRCHHGAFGAFVWRLQGNYWWVLLKVVIFQMAGRQIIPAMCAKVRPLLKRRNSRDAGPRKQRWLQEEPWIQMRRGNDQKFKTHSCVRDRERAECRQAAVERRLSQWRKDNWQLCNETWGQPSYSDDKYGEGFCVYQKIKTY